MTYNDPHVAQVAMIRVLRYLKSRGTPTEPYLIKKALASAPRAIREKAALIQQGGTSQTTTTDDETQTKE